MRLRFGFARLICRNEPGLVPPGFPSLRVSCARSRFSRPPTASKTCKVGWGLTPRSNRTPTQRTGRWTRARRCRTRTLRSDKYVLDSHDQPCVLLTVQSSSRPTGYMYIWYIYIHPSASSYLSVCMHLHTPSTQPDLLQPGLMQPGILRRATRSLALPASPLFKFLRYLAMARPGHGCHGLSCYHVAHP